MSRIPPIRIPNPVIRQIPRPVIRDLAPPVTSGIQPPVVDVPNPIIEYPTIDVPTREQFEGEMEQKPEESTEEEKTESLPPPEPSTIITPSPTINILGVEAPLPEVAPLVTAGATAVVTTSVTLGATIAMGHLKRAAEPMLKQALSSSRRRKIKIKTVKPVLHFVMDDDDKVDVYQYSQEGTKLLDSTTNIEQYLRDEIDTNSLYEYDNKIIIDDVIKQKFTKEGAKRFNGYFKPAKTIAKKLASKIAF